MQMGEFSQFNELYRALNVLFNWRTTVVIELILVNGDGNMQLYHFIPQKLFMSAIRYIKKASGLWGYQLEGSNRL